MADAKETMDSKEHDKIIAMILTAQSCQAVHAFANSSAVAYDFTVWGVAIRKQFQLIMQ